ncbi:hypothetical protein HMPREF9436_02343 [Faecalibacterium cf. prausnitzii KLE1255]|uniref:Uncharacterized protein n=1 Tax=Faecalibacterium cf. prausnitzii KLE1255 TaxID=748224 RepID=E2ZKZ0_9FIRM|nr:hypothetical protein HMPREF9436_02343 [Faecalibacterium cf. prausnitzii KLE1255]
MVTNSRQYSAFSPVRQPFFESFLRKIFEKILNKRPRVFYAPVRLCG